MGEKLGSAEYKEALDYVLSFADYERFSRSAVVFDIKRIEELLRRLGDPHRSAKSVHIAGTKGKGSVAAMTASVLSTAGYSTGLYTSPHLHTMRERIRINGESISENDLIVIVNQMKPEIDETNRTGGLGELTTFEILTALAFVHFHRNNVDFQVIEVGLGGRLDATNVLQSEVCVITSISLDHTEVLGDSLEKISAEKAGIIKPNSRVVSAPQPAEAFTVLRQVCGETGSDLIRGGTDITWTMGTSDLSGQSFKVRGQMDDYDLFIPLLGDHQLENAALAVAALENLIQKGTVISKQSITDGLANVKWDGRLQVLGDAPLIIVDGAHNADSSKKLGEAIRAYFDFDHIVLIVGTSQDKDVAGIVRELAVFSEHVIVTHAFHPRATEACVLVDEFSRWGVMPQIAADVHKAIQMAMVTAGPGDIVCATGSLFIVAEVIEYVKEMRSGQRLLY